MSRNRRPHCGGFNIMLTNARATAGMPAAATEAYAGYSHRRTIYRFGQPAVAAKYPSRFGNAARDRRERRCILQAIRDVPIGTSILDLPCGTGRLMRLFAERGLKLTAADRSPHMLELAEQNWNEIADQFSPEAREVTFELQDILQTTYAAGAFEVVFCNRLFHHFDEAATRVAALTELNRISRGLVIVSFFNSFALDALRFFLKHRLRGTTPRDRIPIPMRTFEQEIAAADLQIIGRIPLLWGISPMWYLVMKSAAGQRSLTNGNRPDLSPVPAPDAIRSCA